MKGHQLVLKGAFILTALLFILAFGAFIYMRMQEPKPVDADFSEIRRALEDEGLTARFEDGNELRVKNAFGLLTSDYEEFLYLYPSYYLDVEEILLVRLPEGAKAETVRNAMEERLTRQKNTFENYGTDQFSTLQNTVIYDNGTYALYSAGHEASECARLIRGMIER